MVNQYHLQHRNIPSRCRLANPGAFVLKHGLLFIVFLSIYIEYIYIYIYIVCIYIFGGEGAMLYFIVCLSSQIGDPTHAPCGGSVES